MTRTKKLPALAFCLFLIFRQTAQGEWWYLEHFPFIYSSVQEWCIIENQSSEIWIYTFSEASWTSSDQYDFDSEWWHVDDYPYIYSQSTGWLYCHTPTNSFQTTVIATGIAETFTGNSSDGSNQSDSEDSTESITPVAWGIQNATVGNSINISLLEAFTIIGATPEFTVMTSDLIAGIEISGSQLVGIPTNSGVVDIRISAVDSQNNTISNTTQLVVAADSVDLPTPVLPESPIDYAAIIANLPDQYASRVDNFGNITNADNTPNNNPVTNAGATLGRVLFYDKRLSLNNAISCASCHKQELGFSDDRQFSLGFAGGETARHSTALSHARYYERGRFFWDERAETLEDQVLMPIQDNVEMGMGLDALREKLTNTNFYAPLFEEAFGDNQITDARISQALAQFIRAMVSTDSKFDQAFVNGELDTTAFTDQELEGLQLFSGNAGTDGRSLGCIRCHETIGFIGDTVHNIGLDPIDTDEGAGNGAFKVQSLRNIAVTAPYMHDGRFETLREVINHYDNGVQDNANLSDHLRRNNGNVRRLNLSETEKNSLEAFLNTLTDAAFLQDERFSDPFTG